MFSNIFFNKISIAVIALVITLFHIQDSWALSIGITTFSDLEDLPNNVDEAVLAWSTLRTRGNVTQNDLITWTINLKSNNTIVYEDTVIFNNSVKPIGGVNRSFSDINFNYNFDNNNLNSFDNDLDMKQLGRSLGTTYRIWADVDQSTPVFRLALFNNGSPPIFNLDLISNSQINTQFISTPSTPIPFEFSPTLGLLVFGSFYGINFLRKAKNF